MDQRRKGRAGSGHLADKGWVESSTKKKLKPDAGGGGQRKMGKRVSPAGGRSRRGRGAALVQGPQYPGQTCPWAGLALWVPGRGEGEALRLGR